MASAHGLTGADSPRHKRCCVGGMSHHLFGVGCSDMSTH